MNAIHYFFVCVILVLVSCSPTSHTYEEILIHIIPEPRSVSISDGYLNIEKDNLGFVLNDGLILPVTDWFQQFKILCSENNNEGIIQFKQLDSIMSHGYRLVVSADGIEISASDHQGFYYGCISLIQMMQSASNYISIPFVEIEDGPRFSYRGMHLDVARHFFDVSFIKKYIDLMAYHKMNTFHWHLTEDQGWRIEIKKYPKLQTIAAFRDETLIGHYNDQPHEFDGKRYGGFYTQEEIKDIVAYASKRMIDIVPEIEMPGHSQAVLAAYPEFGCIDTTYEVMKVWGVSPNVLCPNPQTFQFLEDVIDEVVSLFPGNYIHIGGDECPKEQWKASELCNNLMQEEGINNTHELQSYFIQRMEKYINSKNKSIIGWDEILEGGLAPNATVMSWRGESGGIEAANEGHNVIMTPTSHCYLDYYQSQDSEEPLAIGGNLPLSVVYNYEPIPASLSQDKQQYILGTQANVWTEYMPTSDHVEYMAYPRACALSEINWTQKDKKDYQYFTEKLGTHFQRLKLMDVNYADHLSELKLLVQSSEEGNQAQIFSDNSDIEIQYWSNKSEDKKRYSQPFDVGGIDTLYYAAYQDSMQKSKIYSEIFQQHLATAKKVKLGRKPSEKYGRYGASLITNGVLANPDKFGDKEWLGFQGVNTGVIIDFGVPTKISSVNLGFFHGPAYWIHAPRSIQLSYADDGRDWGQFYSVDTLPKGIKRIPVDMNFEPITSRYLLISIESVLTIPEGNEGAGNPAWLFMDEVIVN